MKRPLSESDTNCFEFEFKDGFYLVQPSSFMFEERKECFLGSDVTYIEKYELF